MLKRILTDQEIDDAIECGTGICNGCKLERSVRGLNLASRGNLGLDLRHALAEIERMKKESKIEDRLLALSIDEIKYRNGQWDLLGPYIAPFSGPTISEALNAAEKWKQEAKK
jgi:hypothetical protein